MLVAPTLDAGSVTIVASATPVDQASALRRFGAPDRALALLEPWLAAHPGDVDARLQSGFALRDLGRAADAELAFRQVVDLAPHYADAIVALADLALARGEGAEALLWIDRLAVGHPELPRLRRAISAQSRDGRWELNVSGQLARLGGRQDDWHQLDAELRYTATPRLALSGRVEASQRFGRRDVYAQAAIATRQEGRSAYVVVGGTTRADYRPVRQVGAGLTVRVHSGPAATVATLDLLHSRFRTGHVTLLQPGIEQIVLGGTTWVTARLVTLVANGKISSGPLLRLDHQAREDLRLYAGVGRTPDTSEGFVSRVTSLFGGVEVKARRREVLRLSIARVKPGRGFHRFEFSAGLGRRF